MRRKGEFAPSKTAGVGIALGVSRRILTADDRIDQQLEKIEEAPLRNDYGYTVLTYAVASERDDPELIKVLLARGAEINVKADDGETALKLAGRKGRTEIVRLLEKAGAKE